MFVIMSGMDRRYLHLLTSETYVWVRTIEYASRFRTEDETKDTATKCGLTHYEILPLDAKL